MADKKRGGKRCREKKTSKEQYEIYCSFLEQHSEMTLKKDGDRTIQYIWDELTILLNSTNSGPIKDKRAWQKTFENWRNSVRHKKRQDDYHRNGNGRDVQGRPTELKELELRALALWGDIVLTDMPKSSTEIDFHQAPPRKTDKVTCVYGIIDEVDFNDESHETITGDSIGNAQFGFSQSPSRKTNDACMTTCMERIIDGEDCDEKFEEKYTPSKNDEACISNCTDGLIAEENCQEEFEEKYTPPSKNDEAFISNNCKDRLIDDEDCHDLGEMYTSDIPIESEPLSIEQEADPKRGTKRKKEVLAPKNVHHSEMLMNVESERTSALQNIGEQLRRLVDVKETEVLESRRRTDAFNNIAEAIKMLAESKRKQIKREAPF